MATVAALPVVVLPEGSSLGMSGGLGFYDGKTGFGIGIAARASDHFAFGAAFGSGEGKASGKVSITWNN